MTFVDDVLKRDYGERGAFAPFVTMIIDGKVLTIQDQRLVSMTFTRTATNASAAVSITFIDTEWDFFTDYFDVENVKSVDIQIFYGYTRAAGVRKNYDNTDRTQYVSDVWKVVSSSISVGEVSIAGIELTLEGTLDGFIEAKTSTFVGSTMGLSINDFIKQVAATYRWALNKDVPEFKKMYVQNSDGERVLRTWTSYSENVMEFLARILQDVPTVDDYMANVSLRPVALLKKESYPQGYPLFQGLSPESPNLAELNINVNRQVFLDSTGKARVDRKYIIGADRNSSVLSYSADIQFFQDTGANGVKGVGQDDKTGEPYANVETPDSHESVKGKTAGVPFTEGVIDLMLSPSQKGIMKAKAKASLTESEQRSMTANLEVWLDVEIEPRWIIETVVLPPFRYSEGLLKRKTKPYISSGRWIVMKVRDEISAGVAKTSMELQRF